MPDAFTENLNLTKPEVGASADTWGTKQNDAFDKIDDVFTADGTGTSVGLHVGADKTLDATGGTVHVTDTEFVIGDEATGTHKARLLVDDLAVGTTDFRFPTGGNHTLVGRTATQTLTNKTLDTPTLTGTATAPTPSPGDNTQNIATTAYVTAAVAAALAGITTFATGDILAVAATSRSGWVPLTGGTLGNASSGGTARANADCSALFGLFWALNSNTWTVNGGRGASASADFAAGKTITLPDARGRALIGLSGTINLTSLFATTGAATHTLTSAEMPAHTHDGLLASFSAGSGGGSGIWVGDGVTKTATTSTGGDGAHNNVQPSMGVNLFIKL